MGWQIFNLDGLRTGLGGLRIEMGMYYWMLRYMSEGK